MFRTTRTHEFCYGHRVYKHETKCSHLHGHNARVEFTCEGEQLDDVGRLIDFSVMKSTLCQWLEDHWDHRMLLYVEDPISPVLIALDPHVTAVQFNPTAENMARYLVETVGPLVLEGTGVRLVSCTLWETSKCSATYGLDMQP
jgi:6-pyruvoyltetrahydropterin/6-carboxytetrahydropterin synthase